MLKTTSRLGFAAVFGLTACGSPTAPAPVTGGGTTPGARTDAPTSRAQVTALPNTPPSAHVSWRVTLPTGDDPPIPGDPVRFSCEASDHEGGELTVTLRLENESGKCPTSAHCWTSADTFKRRPDVTAALLRFGSAPDPAMRGTLTCTVTDAVGASTTVSTCFGMVGFDCQV